MPVKVKNMGFSDRFKVLNKRARIETPEQGIETPGQRIETPSVLVAVRVQFSS